MVFRTTLNGYIQDRWDANMNTPTALQLWSCECYIGLPAFALRAYRRNGTRALDTTVDTVDCNIVNACIVLLV